jgi:hypothetical protein
LDPRASDAGRALGSTSPYDSEGKIAGSWLRKKTICMRHQQWCCQAACSRPAAGSDLMQLTVPRCGEALCRGCVLAFARKGISACSHGILTHSVVQRHSAWLDGILPGSTAFCRHSGTQRHSATVSRILPCHAAFCTAILQREGRTKRTGGLLRTEHGIQWQRAGSSMMLCAFLRREIERADLPMRDVAPERGCGVGWLEEAMRKSGTSTTVATMALPRERRRLCAGGGWHWW